MRRAGGRGASVRGVPLPRLPRLRTADLVTACLFAFVTAANPRAFMPDGTSIAAALGSTGAIGCLFWGFTLTCCAAIAVRTRRPLLSVIAVEAALAAHLLLFDSLSVLAVASCLVAAETIGSRISRPWSWSLLAVMALGSAATVLRISPLFNEEVETWSRLMFVLVTAWSLIGAAYLWGLNRRRARDRVEQMIARAEELVVHAQETAAHAEDRRRLAVIEERQRIARDVHDVLGHSLAVIGMQAEGAKAVLGSDPARAEAALTTIGEMSRVGVDDVRRLVDVLRDDAPETAPDPPSPAGAPDGCAQEGAPSASPPPAPRTGLAELIVLAEGLRSAGREVILRIGASAPIPAVAEDAVSGILREALSNAARHGADPIIIDLRVSDAGIELSVVSEAKRSAEDCASPARAGAGLETMRERAEALGGSLDAGRGSDGRWLVHARLPVPGPPPAGVRG